MSENTKNSKSTIAAGIDIGSNSIRMLVAKIFNGRIIEMIASERATTRLASGLKTSGRISEESFAKSIEVLKHFKNILDNHSVDHIRAFATSAVREADNGNDFIIAAKKIGIDVQIISGEEEARLVFNGVRTGMDTGAAPLILDTGGGSTEIIAVQNSKILFAESYKIGVVKLVDQFDMKLKATENIKPCQEFVSNFFKNVTFTDKYDKFIATAGTATTIAAIDMNLEFYDWQKVNGYTVSKDNIEKLLYKIASIPFHKRINIYGMEAGREDLVIPGMIIILEIMSKAGFTSMTVSDFGLREGAVVAASNY